MREDHQRLLHRTSELLAERDQKVARQGGLTPPDLQAMAGEYAEIANPAFQMQTLPEILRNLADEWERATEDERVLAAFVTISMMHHAHIYAYDLYQATVDVLESTMQDAITYVHEQVQNG